LFAFAFRSLFFHARVSERKNAGNNSKNRDKTKVNDITYHHAKPMHSAQKKAKKSTRTVRFDYQDYTQGRATASIAIQTSVPLEKE
jgi:hypothetical protein